MEQLPYALKQSRLKQLADLQNRITCKINETYVGKTLEVLVEGPSHKNPEMLQGYSREFKMIHFPGEVDHEVRRQNLITVPIDSAHLRGLSGEVVAR